MELNTQHSTLNTRPLPPELFAERIAACIGLVSDTHMPDRLAALPEALFEALRGVDLLLHAGDVGELWVLDQLSAIAPVIAVHGNDETAEAQCELPLYLVSLRRRYCNVAARNTFPDDISFFLTLYERQKERDILDTSTILPKAKR